MLIVSNTIATMCIFANPNGETYWYNGDMFGLSNQIYY